MWEAPKRSKQPPLPKKCFQKQKQKQTRGRERERERENIPSISPCDTLSRADIENSAPVSAKRPSGNTSGYSSPAVSARSTDSSKIKGAWKSAEDWEGISLRARDATSRKWEKGGSNTRHEAEESHLKIWQL